MAPHIKLVSFDICPYVERSRITLEEKGVPYEIEFVDLADKPRWLLEISPRGKVPVLLVDDQPVFESMVINEMLEELHPDPTMFPRDTVARAQCRSWIVFCNDVVMSAFFPAMAAASEDERAAKLDELDAALDKVEAELARRDGPFFAGEAFSLVDATYAPVFNRWPALVELQRDLLPGRPHLQAWKEALLARPAVQRARTERLVDKTIDFARKHHRDTLQVDTAAGQRAY